MNGPELDAARERDNGNRARQETATGCCPEGFAPPKPTAKAGFLEWLRAAGETRFSAPVALVVAHPDDEVIGAGAHLARCDWLTIVHTTDGAPKDLTDATRAGYASRSEYALARRQEFESAMRLVGPARHCGVGLVDQEASFNLVPLTERLRDLLKELRPAVVLTHSYEGGHPDHDATAFSVHAARELLHGEGIFIPELIEMTFYHNQSGRMAIGTFLPNTEVDFCEVVLTEEQQRLKRQLLGCYRSQQATVNAFSVDAERFRYAPRYDFAQPPHSGILFYELFNWGVQGLTWRDLACEALQHFGLRGKM